MREELEEINYFKYMTLAVTMVRRNETKVKYRVRRTGRILVN